MNVRSLGFVALLVTCGSAAAQYPLQGFLYNWDRPQFGDGLGYVTRFGLNPEEHLNRIDRDDYREWGLNAGGQTQVQGFVLWIQDSNDATVETFRIVGYAEAPVGSNLPDVANRLLNAGPYQMPPTGNPPGGVAYELYTTFAQPVSFPTTGDIFIGTSVPALAGTNPNFDGLWTGAVGNDNSGFTPVFDLPGPRGQQGGGIANDTYVCYVVNGSPTYPASSLTSLEQLAIDVHISGGTVGGVALATTNQASYPSSNAPLGTSNFLSGLHPNVPRGDGLGFAVTAHNNQAPVGTFAFVLMAFGPFGGGSLPIQTLFPPAAPGSAGSVCIDFTQAAVFSTNLVTNLNSLPNMNEGQVLIPLNAGAQQIIAAMASPLDIWWQGVTFVVTGTGGIELRTTGCVIQHLK